MKMVLSMWWSDQLGLTRSASKSWISNISANISKIAKSLHCKENLNGTIIVHLNIDTLRNRFDLVVDQIKEIVDVLVISEARLDESFRRGRSQWRGGLMVFYKRGYTSKTCQSRLNQ